MQWTQRMSNRIPRGEAHWIRRMSERITRGERTGAYTHPERIHRGEEHGQAKPNHAAVRAIREAYTHGATQRRLGDAYGVTPTLIGYIVRRKIWTRIV